MTQAEAPRAALEPARYKNGLPCQQCIMALRHGRLCRRHLPPEERKILEEESAERRAYWAAKRADYAKQRTRLNLIHRKRLRQLSTSCAACNSEPAQSRDLHLDHIIPCVEYVRAGVPVTAAYNEGNMWLLCVDCHRAKTKPARPPPPLDVLRRTRWGFGLTARQQSNEWKKWKARAEESKRRLELIRQAYQQRLKRGLQPDMSPFQPAKTQSF